MSGNFSFGIKISYDGKEVDTGVTLNREQLNKLAASAKQATVTSSAGFESVAVAARNSAAEVAKAGRDAAAGMAPMAISAKQTAAALRGVPAQFTDIFTSIAAGQNPMQVMMQQGGQLKDMFGGVGAAARALGGYVVGLINPFTVGAAAAGALAFAYYQGSKEGEQLRRTLIETGGVAGVTGDQLQDMARKVSSSTSATRGAATDVLNALAGSGTVAAANFDKLTRAALALERVGGVAASETAKQFAELGSLPVEASKKLNDQAHYLTLTLYKQIEALKNSGNVAAAASLAQNAWADAILNRTPKLEANLGTLEKSWRAVASGAKTAWDAMLDIGRKQTDEERIKELSAPLLVGRGVRIARTPAEARELATLQKRKADTEAAAKATADAQEKEDAGLKKLEITRREAAAQLDVQEARLKAWYEEYGDTIKRSLSDSSVSYADFWKLVEAGERHRAEEELRFVNARRAAAHQRGDNDEEIKLKGEAAVLRSRLKSGISAEVGRGLAADLARQKKDAEDIIRALNDDFRKADETRTRSFTLDQMTESQRRLAEALNTVNDRARAAREALDVKFPEKERGAKAYTDQVKNLTIAQEAAAQSAREWAARQDELNRSWEYGASQALRSYLDEVQNVAKQSEQAFGRAFKGMEDALVNFVKTGKLDFSSLADSIISDMIRMQVQQQITKPLAQAASGGGGFFGSIAEGITDVLGLKFAAKGDVFSSPDLHQYANQVIAQPTLFKFASGGVFGEAGPEAIMPLKRGPDGNLGVRAHGGGSNAPSVVIYDQRSAATSSPVQTELGTGPDGMAQVRVFIADEVRSQIGNGKFDAPMRNRYGATPVVTRRG